MELAASQLVKLYMQTQITMGYIYYAPTPEARLLDALNGLSDIEPIRPVKRGRFLELSNVTIQHMDGAQEKLSVAYVNKATVQLAGTPAGADAGRGIGAQTGSKPYPFVEKSPVPVWIETQSYVITGNMYHIASQKVWQVLEDSPIFLPITHAQICTVANGVRERVPFVAVNKEHILSLQQEDTGSAGGQKAAESDGRKSSRRPL